MPSVTIKNPSDAPWLTALRQYKTYRERLAELAQKEPDDMDTRARSIFSNDPQDELYVLVMNRWSHPPNIEIVMVICDASLSRPFSGADIPGLLEDKLRFKGLSGDQYRASLVGGEVIFTPFVAEDEIDFDLSNGL